MIISLFLIGLTAATPAAPGPRPLQDLPAEVQAAVQAAGGNGPQVEAVLTHFVDAGDTLKFQAACYLIGNMDGHSYVTYRFQDTAGQVVSFDPLAFADYESLTTAFDSLERVHGPLDYVREDEFRDLETVSADYLISEIDLAFQAWRGKPWAHSMSFGDFCEYVLPYRGSNEPLESWRELFLDKYQDLPTRMNDPSDPIEAAALINADVRTWFGFDPRYYFHPTDQGLSEMLGSGKGRCEDMTNLTIYALRANGIAVTSDYTPFWADFGNNHAWNAIVTPDGRAIPFMGAEADPGQYQLSHKAAKIYRKTYSRQASNLVFQPHRQDSLPRWLAGKNYRDVTAEYFETCDVTVRFDRSAPDSVDVAYLCVFNSGQWQPINWGRIAGDSAVFTDIAREIAYLPALYLNGEPVPFGAPFILSSDCLQVALEADTLNTAACQVLAAARHLLKVSDDGAVAPGLVAGQSYELWCWQDGWQPQGKQTAGDGPLLFENVPSGGLYWLTLDGSNREEERIFTLDDGRQVWW